MPSGPCPTILGFLSLSPRNGYQLRAAVRRSVGSFWGVSYGQLYPQLKTLAQAAMADAELSWCDTAETMITDRQ